jgi:hypothetical protein
MYAIADHVVDSYLEVTSLVETDIDTTEVEVFSPGSRAEIEHIYLIKHEVVHLRRAVSPLSVALQRILSEHRDLIASKEIGRYLRDVIVIRRWRPIRLTVTTKCSARWSMPRWPGRDATEHRFAQDLSVGGYCVGHHHGGGDIRHELRAHARAPTGVGVPRGVLRHGRRLRRPLPRLPPKPLALIGRQPN